MHRLEYKVKNLENALQFTCKQLNYATCVPCDFNKSACKDCIHQKIEANDFMERTEIYNHCGEDEISTQIDQYLTSRASGMYG